MRSKTGIPWIKYPIHKQISPRYSLVNAHQFELYLEALGHSGAMLQPKENMWKSCRSEIKFLGFLPIILDRRNKRRLANVTQYCKVINVICYFVFKNQNHYSGVHGVDIADVAIPFNPYHSILKIVHPHFTHTFLLISNLTITAKNNKKPTYRNLLDYLRNDLLFGRPFLPVVLVKVSIVTKLSQVI